MVTGLFVGLSVDTLEDLRDAALALIVEGKTLMTHETVAGHFEKQFAMPPREVLAEALHALNMEQGKKVRVVFASFSGE